MPGLERAVADLANAAGVELTLGRAVPWLSGRGHLNEVVQSTAPVPLIATLAEIHMRLGGDAALLASKRAGSPPTPDLVHVPTGTIVEVDEVQHFSSARAQALDLYPEDIALGFDLGTYRGLIETWRPRADRAYAHKSSADFPSPGGRQAQRAYNDALRDLLAPTFTGRPVVRLAVPDRSLDGIVDRLTLALPSR